MTVTLASYHFLDAFTVSSPKFEFNTLHHPILWLLSATIIIWYVCFSFFFNSLTALKLSSGIIYCYHILTTWLGHPTAIYSGMLPSHLPDHICLYYIIYCSRIPCYTSTRKIPCYVTGVYPVMVKFHPFWGFSHSSWGWILFTKFGDTKFKTSATGHICACSKWLWSHSPMKHLGPPPESFVSLNSIYRTFRTFSKVLPLLTQHHDS
jgi:hypothetical protein